MQSMNQSLIALVLNGVISKETALAASINPSELDMELRKFLYGIEQAAKENSEMSIADFMDVPGGGKGDTMADSFADFSKIVELQEIKKLYEESREKHTREIAEKDEAIQTLEHDTQTKHEEIVGLKTQLAALQQDREKLRQQLTFAKSEAEQKIQRLQERIQQLTASPAAAGIADSKSKGFFKK
jgi:predicted RNase H-like nuclease (RuvC/YqgF family)